MHDERRSPFGGMISAGLAIYEGKALKEQQNNHHKQAENESGRLAGYKAAAELANDLGLSTWDDDEDGDPTSALWEQIVAECDNGLVSLSYQRGYSRGLLECASDMRQRNASPDCYARLRTAGVKLPPFDLMSGEDMMPTETEEK
jgi:hypothetical protein